MDINTPYTVKQSKYLTQYYEDIDSKGWLYLDSQGKPDFKNLAIKTGMEQILYAIQERANFLRLTGIRKNYPMTFLKNITNIDYPNSGFVVWDNFNYLVLGFLKQMFPYFLLLNEDWDYLDNKYLDLYYTRPIQSVSNTEEEIRDSKKNIVFISQKGKPLEAMYLYFIYELISKMCIILDSREYIKNTGSLSDATVTYKTSTSHDYKGQVLHFYRDGNINQPVYYKDWTQPPEERKEDIRPLAQSFLVKRVVDDDEQTLIITIISNELTYNIIKTNNALKYETETLFFCGFKKLYLAPLNQGSVINDFSTLKFLGSLILPLGTTNKTKKVIVNPQWTASWSGIDTADNERGIVTEHNECITITVFCKVNFIYS